MNNVSTDLIVQRDRRSAHPVPVLVVAGVLDVVFLVVAFGARTLRQLRQTGESGWRLGRPHSAAEAVARSSMVASGLLLGASLFVGDAGDGVGAAVGMALAAGSILLVWVAQVQMGASWRIGVDPQETTELVAAGLYRWIRNPIYTGMVAFAVGQALMVRTPVTWLAAAAMLVGVEVQVRGVEEPYLDRTHGEAFRRLRASSGRFVPLLGRAP
jgi:protein-S-isoprenylcysteine O-methyltransferase Ste14